MGPLSPDFHVDDVFLPLRTRRLTVRQIFNILFFHPSALFLLREDRFSRAFRLFALVSFLCGVASGAVLIPRLVTNAMDWSRWVGRTLGAIEVVDGRLHWERRFTEPYTTRHAGWRVDIVPEGSAFRLDPTIVGPEDQGVVISPERVLCWWRVSDARLYRLAVFADGRVFGSLPIEFLLPKGERLSPDELPHFVARYLAWQIPVFLVYKGIALFLSGLFYTSLFAFIPFAMRSPIASGGFRRLMIFYLYAAIPAMIVSTVYASLRLPYLDQPFLFVIVLVVYLAIATRAAMRALMRGDGSQDR